jgi:hypothetical protein
MKSLMLYKTYGFCLLILGGFALTGCSNKDFDLSNIDGTVGFGGDSLSLPGNNSTENIKLDDVLKLDNSDCVKILDNGNYTFTKSDDNVSPAHPEIAQVNVSQNNHSSIPYYIFGANNAKRHNVIQKETSTTYSGSFGGDILAFDYHYTGVPSEILALDEVNANSKYVITVSFSAEIKNNISTFKTLGVGFPKFLKISSVTCNGVSVPVTDNTISMSNISTADNLSLVVQTSGLDFNASSSTGSTLSFSGTDRKIDVLGIINISGSFDVDILKLASIDKNACVINSDLDMSDFIITGATGKFSPSISFNNIGSVTLNNIPDFLSDKDVNIDLYNPQIELTLTSDLPVTGLVTGSLVSKYDNGKADVSVSIPQFSVKPNGTTKICICKNSTGITGYDQVVTVSNLSDIIKVIPKSITFNADAMADASVTSTIELGKQYTVQPSYSMNAPLSFSDDASIVYRDTLDDWNDDVKDLQLTDGGYVRMTTSAVNQVPVYLTLSGYGIDVNGNEISSSELFIKVDRTIDASSDGVTTKTTPLTITITPINSSVFKKLDGIVIKAVGAASNGVSPVSGVTINAYNQTLKLSDIKIQIVGKMVYLDSDDK